MKSARPRQTTNLSEALFHRVNIYAVGATAAGVGILAAMPPAEAKIVYTHAHHSIGPGHSLHLNLNHDKMTDVLIQNSYNCNQDFCVDNISAIAANGNGVEGRHGFLSIPYASALKAGAKIGPSQVFSGKLMGSYDQGQGTIGQWINVNNRYLGIKFGIQGKIHYGWARLNVNISSGSMTALLTGYAYETVPDKPIIAGKTKGMAAMTVLSTGTPTTLGKLAVGR